MSSQKSIVSSQKCGAIGVVACLVLLGMSGCIVGPQHPEATRVATDIDKETSTAEYWLKQPAAATVMGGDFDKLWNAADKVTRSYDFRVDRTDYRGGVLTTEPVVSKQAFEIWRRDAGSWRGLEESTLATVRRTIRFEFDRKEDGSFAVTPKVLVERESLSERRITSAIQYTTVFSGPAELEGKKDEFGQRIRPGYWYAIGRDTALERQLAESIRGKM